MTPAERVSLHRWVNRVEAAADELLALIKAAPSPLPRKPVFDPELLNALSDFTIGQDDASDVDYENVRFLALGNGHQAENKARALAAAAHFLPGAKILDRRTLSVPPYGSCHFAAFTHLKGAMISTPADGDAGFGSRDWHDRRKMVLFRDAGDGRCIIYINDIEPLFGRRTIGQHGVPWGEVEKLANFVKVIASADANTVAAAAG